VLGAAGVHALLTRTRTLALAVCWVVAVLCVAPIALEEGRFLSWVSGRRSTAAYYDGYGEAGNDMRAVAWLGNHGIAGKIYVFGWNTSVGWLSRRETVSRFGFSMPLLLGEGTPLRSQYRDELLQSLRADPPRYIVVGTQSQQILGRVLTIHDFPELADLIRTSYEKVAEFGQVQIHQLGPAVARVQ
jgi:hypothetical protein